MYHVYIETSVNGASDIAAITGKATQGVNHYWSKSKLDSFIGAKTLVASNVERGNYWMEFTLDNGACFVSWERD